MEVVLILNQVTYILLAIFEFLSISRMVDIQSSSRTRTWTKYICSSGLIQEIIILRRNHATNNHHDVPGKSFMN